MMTRLNSTLCAILVFVLCCLDVFVQAQIGFEMHMHHTAMNNVPSRINSQGQQVFPHHDSRVDHAGGPSLHSERRVDHHNRPIHQGDRTLHFRDPNERRVVRMPHIERGFEQDGRRRQQSRPNNHHGHILNNQQGTTFRRKDTGTQNNNGVRFFLIDRDPAQDNSVNRLDNSANHHISFDDEPERKFPTQNVGSSHTPNIVFPGSQPNAFPNDFSRLPSVSLGDDECSLALGETYYNGICEKLLQKATCRSGSWLVISTEDGFPHCQKRKCPESMIHFQNNCVHITSMNACPIGELLYLDFSGHAYCDCEPDFVYDKNLLKCFAENQQGSCPFGSVLTFDEFKELNCVSVPCQRDDLIYNAEDGLCYNKQYLGNCTAEVDRSVFFDSVQLVATCNVIGERNIFEVPSLRSCPAGSKRDFFGRCKQVFRSNPTNPFSYRVPTQLISRYSCPRGFTRLPSGSCRRANNFLFG